MWGLATAPKVLQRMHWSGCTASISVLRQKKNWSKIWRIWGQKNKIKKLVKLQVTSEHGRRGPKITQLGRIIGQVPREHASKCFPCVYSPKGMILKYWVYEHFAYVLYCMGKIYLLILPTMLCSCHFLWAEKKTQRTLFFFCNLLVPSVHYVMKMHKSTRL